MTEKEIRYAVARGQGRAILFMRSAADQGYFDLILELCSRDQAFDRWFEDRVDYMWRLANTLPRPGELAGLLGKRLFEAKRCRDRMQVRGILGRFRRDGNANARESLLADFQRFGLKERPFAEAVSLLGLEGFEILVGEIGRLDNREIGRAYGDAVTEFGKRSVDRIFRRAANTNIEVRRLMSGLRVVNHRPEDSVTVEECLEQLRAGNRVSPHFFRIAGKADWIEVAKIATESTGETVLRNARRLMLRRPWPLDAGAALQQALAEQNPARRRLRLLMLKSTAHDSLRNWALEQLLDHESLKDNVVAFDLLGANAEPRDLPVIADALRSLMHTKVAFHFAGLSVLNLRIKPSVELLQLIYEFGPCDECRSYAVIALAKRGALTPAQLEECVEDSDSYTRQLGVKHLRRRGRI